MKNDASIIKPFNGDMLIYQRGTPNWIKEFCPQMVSLLGLQAFSFDVYYTSLRAANKLLARHGYRPLVAGDVGAVHVDTKYLMSEIILIKPILKGRDTKRRIAHEFLHVEREWRVYDEIRKQIVTHYTAPERRDVIEEALLSIQETDIEHTLNHFDRLGLFD